MKILSNKNVFDAALERINYLFDEFPNVVAGISGGKDSSLLDQSVGANGKDVTAADVKKTEERLATRFGYGSDIHKQSEKELCCPACGHVYFVSGN